MVEDNERLRELNELLKLSLWAAMDISSSKQDGLAMVRKNFPDLDVAGSFPFENNPLPRGLRDINVINPEVGIKLLLEFLKAFTEFINEIIRNIEKYFPGSREEWIIHYSETKLMEFYDLVLVLEMEIKGQFAKCINDFIKKPGHPYDSLSSSSPDWVN